MNDYVLLASHELQSPANWGHCLPVVFVAMVVLSLPVAVSGQTNTFPASGNAGVGTMGPESQFTVSGAGQNTGNFNTAGSLAGALGLDDTGTAPGNGGAIVFSAYSQNWKFAAIKGTVENGGGNSQGAIVLSVRPVPTNSALTEAMRVDYSGNVGIGTTSPAYPLDISGTGITALRINGTAGNSDSNDTQLRFAGGKSGELWAIGPDVATNSGSRDFSFWALGGVGPVMTLQNTSGNVGIGTTAPVHLLQVAGTIGAEEVIVSSTGADYVFQPDYRLTPLNEVSAYIKENHHLPGVPSATEMQANGLSLGEMQVKLLAKVEELTLHMIQVEQENSDLKDRVKRLEAAGDESNSRAK